MSSKDIMMESIVNLMWTEEEEADPNGCAHQLLIECGGGMPFPPYRPPFAPAQMCTPRGQM